jgi:ankyrin repeat protein
LLFSFDPRNPSAHLAPQGNTTVLAVAVASGTASEGGRIRVVQRLLRLGVNVNKANDQGWTPLMIAVINDRRSLVPFLLDQGALLGATNAQVRQVDGRLSWVFLNVFAQGETPLTLAEKYSPQITEMFTAYRV